MTPKQKRRLFATLLILVGVGIAAALAIAALSENVSYLYSPTTLKEKNLQPGTRFRLGGVVLEDSVRREGMKVRFAVTDRVNQHEVFYEGILPDLFREGQSVIAHGRLGDDNVFVADKVLAKHDETYMPKEVMDAMERAQKSRDAGPGTRDPGSSRSPSSAPEPSGNSNTDTVDGQQAPGTQASARVPSPESRVPGP